MGIELIVGLYINPFLVIIWDVLRLLALLHPNSLVLDHLDFIRAFLCRGETLVEVNR